MPGLRDATGRCVKGWCGPRCLRESDWLFFFESHEGETHFYLPPTRSYWPDSPEYVGGATVIFQRVPDDLAGWAFEGCVLPNAQSFFWPDIKEAVALGGLQDLRPGIGFLPGGFIAVVRRGNLRGTIRFPWLAIARPTHIQMAALFGLGITRQAEKWVRGYGS